MFEIRPFEKELGVFSEILVLFQTLPNPEDRAAFLCKGRLFQSSQPSVYKLILAVNDVIFQIKKLIILASQNRIEGLLVSRAGFFENLGQKLPELNLVNLDDSISGGFVRIAFSHVHLTLILAQHSASPDLTSAFLL